MFTLWIKDGGGERPLGNYETIEAAAAELHEIGPLLIAELHDNDNGDIYQYSGIGFELIDM